MKKLLIIALTCTGIVPNIQTKSSNIFLNMQSVFTDLGKNCDYLIDTFCNFSKQESNPFKDLKSLSWIGWSEGALPTKEIVVQNYFKNIGIPSAVILGAGTIAFIAATSIKTKKQPAKKLITWPLMGISTAAVVAACIHACAHGTKAFKLIELVPSETQL